MNTQTATFNPETDNLAALQAQYDKATAAPRAGKGPSAPQHIAASLVTVQTFGNGETRTTVAPKDGRSVAYATPDRQGMIVIPGAGETSVDAAKACGLLPHTWKEGDPLPFDKAPAVKTGGNTSASTSDKKASAAAPSATSEGDSASNSAASDLAAMEQRAKEASKILSGVDQYHGSHVTDQFLSEAVNSDELPDPATLPAGVTASMVQKVYAGFMAQAEHTLSSVGANVSLLSELCTDDELWQARQATVTGDKERLTEIGKAAVERLAKLPEQDPEGFLEMVEGMTPAERKMLYKRGDGGWTVRAPGHPELSFGAAVRAGLVRT